MSVTSSLRLDTAQLRGQLPDGFSATGAALTSTGAKTISANGVTDAQLQAAITAAAATFVDLKANAQTLRSRAAAALANNATFLAIGAPTQAQAVAQVQALTRQMNALIRVTLSRFDSTADS